MISKLSSCMSMTTCKKIHPDLHKGIKTNLPMSRTENIHQQKKQLLVFLNHIFGTLWFESWILYHLSIRNTGNGELWLWAFHTEPPSEEVFDKVSVTESRPVPKTILAWTSVSTKEGKTFSNFLPWHQPHLERKDVFNVYTSNAFHIDLNIHVLVHVHLNVPPCHWHRFGQWETQSLWSPPHCRSFPPDNWLLSSKIWDFHFKISSHASFTLNVQSFPPSFTFLKECTLAIIRNVWRRKSLDILVFHTTEDISLSEALKKKKILQNFLLMIPFLANFVDFPSTALLFESDRRSCRIGGPPRQELQTDWALLLSETQWAAHSETNQRSSTHSTPVQSN